jgi:hypothetical protein
VEYQATISRDATQANAACSLRDAGDDHIATQGTDCIPWDLCHCLAEWRSAPGRDRRKLCPDGHSAHRQGEHAAYQGDPQCALGLTYEEVPIPSPLGELPIWLVLGERRTWVLLVHGRRATREESLRVLPTIAELGFPALVMTYRNDAEAPKSPDQFYHIGDTEWEDVEASVRYAFSQGVRDVVLFGWSMGGCPWRPSCIARPKPHGCGPSCSTHRSSTCAECMD